MVDVSAPTEPLSETAPSPRHSLATTRLKILLAHDWLVGYRGGEAVLDRIAASLTLRGHQIIGITTLFDDKRPLTPTLDALPRWASWLDRIPYSKAYRRWMLPLFRDAVEDLSVQLDQLHREEPFDVLVSTSSSVMKNVRPPEGVPHVCYCHSPARYLWSQTEQYGRGLRGLGLGWMMPSFRAWDRHSETVDTFLANSTHTSHEIRRCFGRGSRVVFPPVRTELFVPRAQERQQQWLAVGALETYKRFDLAIEAANARNHPLLVVGGGSDARRLRSLAGPTVRFAGRISDEALVREMQRSRLLLFPQVEDFGIVAAEALASGLPVVARRAGGALDMIEDGAEGALFDKPDVASVLEAIDRCPSDAAACHQRAQEFRPEHFDAAIVEAVEDALKGCASRRPDR